MGKRRKKQTLAPIELDAKKAKKTENLDDFRFEFSDLPAKEASQTGWKDVILPDAALQTADLEGLGMFEEIDGSEYNVIKARANSAKMEDTEMAETEKETQEEKTENVDEDQSVPTKKKK